MKTMICINLRRISSQYNLEKLLRQIHIQTILNSLHVLPSSS